MHWGFWASSHLKEDSLRSGVEGLSWGDAWGGQCCFWEQGTTIVGLKAVRWVGIRHGG